MQRTTVDGCKLADGSPELGESCFLQAVVGIEPDNKTSLLATFGEFVIFSMGWQQKKVVELDN